MTDLEFYEIRYSGSAARLVRGFRAIYLGLLFNCMIMATVNLAACKIAGILFGLPRWQTLLVRRPAERRLRRALRAVGRARHRHDPVLHQDDGGDRGGVLRAAGAAGRRAARAGRQAVGTARARAALNYLSILPDFTNNWDLAVAVFIMPIAVQWWAVWYPGAEPGGGSYIAQRMLASKSEKDALGAVLFFNVAHYVLRPWPWILVALCSIIVYPELSRHPDGVSASGSATARPRHRLSGDAQVPAGRVCRPDGRRPDRREFLDHPHAPELGRVVPGARLLPPVHHDRCATSGTTCAPARVATVAAVRVLVSRWSTCSTRPRTRSTSSSRSAPAPGCCTSCAGSGGGSTRGAKSWRWSARS